MKKTLLIIAAIIVLGAVITGLVIVWSNTGKPQPIIEEEVEQLKEADSAIDATISWSKVKNNTVVLTVSGLGNNYTSLAYEVSYETQGVVQGVTSKPLDITNKDIFTRDDIYLGTCSRNVCRPHTGVKKVSLVLEFTDIAGKKSQLTKDFDL